MSLLIAGCSNGRGSIDGKPLSSAGDPAPNLSSSPVPLNILVFGGTSGIGLQTTKLALQRGHKVTSITRRPERMPMEHENLTNLKGDITKRETYNDLIASKDSVISAIGLKPSRKPITVYSEGIKNVLAAMQEANVARVITVTGIGAGDSKGHGGFVYDRIVNPFMLKTDYEDKNRQEAILTASDSKWTIIRPGFLTDDAGARGYRVIRDMQGVISGDIARADVAHFILGIVEQDAYLRETVFLSN